MGRKRTFSLIEKHTTIAQRKKPRLFYGYILVAIAVCIEIIAWGIYNSFGVFFNSLLAEFEWSRATLSGAASLSQIMVGLGAIFFGNLNDRLGPRLLVAAGGILIGWAISYVILNAVWQLYLFTSDSGIGLRNDIICCLPRPVVYQTPGDDERNSQDGHRDRYAGYAYLYKPSDL
jgi:MFS-type transporter involved in bile tolerance (Atg22 family)